jgi:peptidoglycan-N-acetylglucosamine deacetylase
MNENKNVNRNWNWPGGAQVAVSLTFDVDAESPYLGAGAQYERCLSTLSDARFGVTRGLPKILSLLGRHGLHATFFVPGETARRHPQAVAAILASGHEIGHHGDLHKKVHLISEQEQIEEMERGLAALQAAGAPRPRGYRSPGWEMTPETFELICCNDFVYDSSLMGDDRPYFESFDGHQLLELPVSWTLDDWPLVGWSPHFQQAKLSSPDVLFSCWLSEYREARAEKRHVSFTMHPEVIGRSSRFAALCKLIEIIASDDGVWIAKMEDVARHAARVLARKEPELTHSGS